VVKTGAFIVSFVLALFQFLYSLTDDYLGDCSFDTGYEPEAGIMGVVPVVMLGLGLFEIVVPVSLRRRVNKLHLYILGAAVAVFGLGANSTSHWRPRPNAIHPVTHECPNSSRPTSIAG
jgi:hypothetical protein